MIVILHNLSNKLIAKKAKENFDKKFNNNISVVLMSDSEPMEWSGEIDWNDLLIVLFDESSFSDEVDGFIRNYLSKRPDTALLLPVALNDEYPVPPKAAQTYKALPFDKSDVIGSHQNIIYRAGAMLGLSLQGRNTNVFISYRAVDGRKVANQIHQHLLSLGLKPWLDEAKEPDGNTSILPGEPVQAEIEEALVNASLLLLVDTPQSPHSKWIREEINIADGGLIPILPVVFRGRYDLKKGPRFRTLLSLQRWVDITVDTPVEDVVLSSEELEKITKELEVYLCEIFTRKCRVPFLAQKSFTEVGYDWVTLDSSLSMYSSCRQESPRLRTTINSHCSIFSNVYGPSYKRFKMFLNTQPHANHSLFIYDGELLSEDELSEWFDNEAIVLHHQEISALLSSNFTKLGGV